MFRGSVLAIVAQVLVGSSIAVLGALRDYPLYAGQGLRYALAMLLIAIVLRAAPERFDVLSEDAARPAGPPAGTGQRIGRSLLARDYARLLGMALTGMVGFNLCVLSAERRADPALVGVIVGGAPIVLAIVTPLLARRMPSGRLVFAGVLVTTGVAIAQGLGGGAVTGVLLAGGALAGEVSFALLSVTLARRIGAMRVSTYACATAVLLCILGTAVTGEFRAPTATELLALAWMGAGATAVAYV